MKTSGMSAILLFVGVFLLVASESRNKRQTSDLTASEYFAIISLGRKPIHGCSEIGCGLIDIAKSGKRKRGDFVPNEEDRRKWAIMEALVEKEAENLDQQMTHVE